MENKASCLKHAYTFGDFLFYVGMLALPVITAVVGILAHSIAGFAGFLVLAMTGVVVMLRFFCSHCPHYLKEGKTLKCIFFWGLPKPFKKRPGKLSPLSVGLSFGLPILIFLYPLYWLAKSPELLVIYLLSFVLFGAAIRRYECPRCTYEDCPANIAPKYNPES